MNCMNEQFHSLDRRYSKLLSSFQKRYLYATLVQWWDKTTLTLNCINEQSHSLDKRNYFFKFTPWKTWSVHSALFDGLWRYCFWVNKFIKNDIAKPGKVAEGPGLKSLEFSFGCMALVYTGSLYFAWLSAQ